MKKHLILILFILFAIETQAVIRYVRPAASGAGDGSSWANASNDLQLMVNNSAAGDTVWVAAGTYFPRYTADGYNAAASIYPTTDGGRDNAFILKEDVQLFGGFPNTGTPTWANRDWTVYPTILSGQRGDNPNFTDSNCCHVVISAGNVGTACLDGFTITRSRSFFVGLDTVVVNGYPVLRYRGAGIHNTYSSPTLTNLCVDSNRDDQAGGSIYNYFSSPILTNAMISNNSSTYYAHAGGIQNDNSSPILTNVIISHNGLGMANSNNSSPILTNVTISDNGWGMSNYSSSPMLTDVTISNSEIGINNSESNPVMINVVITNNILGIINTNSSPTLTNVAVNNNSGNSGTGIVNSNSSPILTNVTIVHNNLRGTTSAVSNTYSFPVLTNVLISGNSTNGKGGGIYNGNYSNATLTNVTICNNVASSGGGICNDYGSSFTIRNSIVWGNRDTNNAASDVVNFGSIYYQNCLIGGEPLGNGIIANSDPFFIDTASGNYRLQCISPAIDAGNNGYIWAVNADLDSNSRIYNDTVDLGAYEYQGDAVLPPISITSNKDTTICYGDTAVISLVFNDVSPWQFTYTEDNGVSYDTVNAILDTLYNLQVNPLQTTNYRFATLKARGCVFPVIDNIHIQVVNPVFTNDFSDDTLCSGEATNPVVFTGDANFYEWTATGIVSGLPAGLQTGDFNEYILENKGNTPQIDRITVTPKYVGSGITCVGEDTNFSITVLPEPTLTNFLQNDTLCDEEATKPVVFTGATNYEWTATGNVSGIPNNGVDSFGTYTVTNKTANRTKSVITVKPKYTMGSKECEGDNADFEIVVNPATVIESITLNTQSKLLCEGDTLSIEAIASGENLVYQWYQDGNLLLNERNKDFIVSSVTQAHSGEYYVVVSGACGTENSQTVSIDAGGGNMLVEKWHDVILVDNSGLKYVGYQWYRDGRMLTNATEQFYQEIGGLNGCYSVELRLSNGGRTRSCEHCAYKTEKSAIYVYPNPTTGKFTILDLRFDDLRLNDLQLEIYDVVGNLLQSKIVNQQSKIVIDISHLSAGIYFLKIQTEDGTVMKKVVKE